MKLNFSKGAWDTEDVTYAYTYRFEETPVFIQREDCIENSINPDTSQGYDNITLLTKKQYGPHTKLTARCAFDSGAPLITITDKLYIDERGFVRFGDYLEVVLYENGINVWRMWMNDGEVTWKKLMGVEFHVNVGEMHTISVLTEKDRLVIQADDRKMNLYIDDMYESYHVGINACEGINRFYEMEIVQE